MEFLYSVAASLFEGKDIPEWISQHPAIKNRKIKKVFPSIGLPNFKEKVELQEESFAPDYYTPFVNGAISGIKHELLRTNDIISDAFEAFRSAYLSGVTDENDRNDIIEEMSGLQKEGNILININKSFNDSIGAECIVPMPDGRVKLILSKTLSANGKDIVKEGTSIFRAFNTIKVLVDNFFKKCGTNNKMIDLDQKESMKTFHKLNVPIGKQENYISFSSSGEEGAWDIATMSMRGISSCQSWDSSVGNGEHRPCIIGSIASNYVGIIYLTSGKDFEGKGSKMIRRCIVRFGIDMSKPKKERHPVIIVDKMYDSYHPVIAKLFLEAIKKRSEVPVLDFTNSEASTENIKLPEQYLPNIINQNEKNQQLAGKPGFPSYQDSDFEYIKKQKNNDNKDLIKQNRKSVQEITDKLVTYFHSSFNLFDKSTDTREISEVFNRALSDLIFKITTKNDIMSRPSSFVKKYFLIKAKKLRLNGVRYDFDNHTLKVIDKIMGDFRKYVGTLFTIDD
jgi:hypothetical protein